MLFWIMAVLGVGVYVIRGLYETCSEAFLAMEDETVDIQELCPCFLNMP